MSSPHARGSSSGRDDGQRHPVVVPARAGAFPSTTPRSSSATGRPRTCGVFPARRCCADPDATLLDHRSLIWKSPASRHLRHRHRSMICPTSGEIRRLRPANRHRFLQNRRSGPIHPGREPRIRKPMLYPLSYEGASAHATCRRFCPGTRACHRPPTRVTCRPRSVEHYGDAYSNCAGPRPSIRAQLLPLSNLTGP